MPATLPAPKRLRPLAAWPLLLVLAACGSAETPEETTGTPDASDGRYHPPANGVHVSEEAACKALTDEHGKRLIALQCTGTTHLCPEFLRAQFTTACLEYDEGSVQGCIAYYGEATTCDELRKAIDDCAITPYPGTEPKGCP